MTTDAPIAATPRVVLASQSPRRRELLTQVGIVHEVRPADIDETPLPEELPDAHTVRLATDKATLIARQEPGALVVGSDTVVVIDGDILGKPRDADDAKTMLRRLSGRSHAVHTAVAVVQDDNVETAIEVVNVRFRELTDTEIEDYVATGEPMDKAGAYGIQGYGAAIVEYIDGDYFAVMGLPLCRVVCMLERRGYPYRFGRTP